LQGEQGIQGEPGADGVGGGLPIDFENGSFLDAGDPSYGSNAGGGIEQICSIDYRMRWEGGRLWFYDQSSNGEPYLGGAMGVREVRMNFSDPTVNDDSRASLRFRVGSRWVHENGSEWVCSDATEGAAVWELVAAGAEPITSITDDGNGNLTIYTADASYGPFALKGQPGETGAQGSDGGQGPQGPQGNEATPITSITDDGNGNLTIHTAGASYGPFALKGADGAEGPQGPAGGEGSQGPAGPEATPITSITDDGSGNLTINTATSSYGPFALKGEQGSTGPAGNDGGEGPQGIQGEQGIQGIQGEQGPPGTTVWGDLTGVPSTFPPDSHTHDAADITSGTLNGNLLPAISTGVRGGVPPTGAASGKFLKDNDTFSALPTEIQVACSDETTALTAGTNKVTFRMPYTMTLTGVRASVTTAPNGSNLIVDINENGTSILSTKLSIDGNGNEKTSTTATSAAVLSDTSLADDAEITIDIDQIGSTVAGAGLKVTLIGTRV
jgi:hypothetical protein